MSDSTGSVHHAHSSGTASAAATGAAAKAQAVHAAGGGGGGNPDSKTKISSVADLKKKAPKVWNAMLLTIAQTMCNQMHHSSERLKQIIKDGERRD